MIPARAASLAPHLAHVEVTRPELGQPIDETLRAEILDLWADGFDTDEIASEVFRHEADVQRVIASEQDRRRAKCSA